MLNMAFLDGFGRMARAAADFVQAQISCDGEKPGGKLGGALVTLPRFVNLQKNILRQILGLGFVAQRPADEIEKRLLVFLDQFSERHTIATFHAQHQGGIRVGVFRHRWLSLINAGRTTRFRCDVSLRTKFEQVTNFNSLHHRRTTSYAPVQDLLKKIEAAAEARLSFAPTATPAEKLARYKTFLKVEAHRLKLLHRGGADGREICQARAAILDALLKHLWTSAKESLSAQGQKEFPSIALVAIGGFGRAELNPHSDIDFMFLHEGQVAAGKPRPYLAKLIDSVLYPLWDIGL